MGEAPRASPCPAQGFTPGYIPPPHPGRKTRAGRPLQRRAFLAHSGRGFAGLALAAMLHRDGALRADAPGTWAPPTGKPHFAPKAKSVIWLFMNGGVSHMETFDPKPMLTKYAGKTIAETPFRDAMNPERLAMNNRVVVINDANGQQRSLLYPLQVGFRKHGQ